jgi:hypothetical protein
MDTIELFSDDLSSFLDNLFAYLNNSPSLVFNHRQYEGVFFALMTASSLSKSASTATTLGMVACCQLV